MSIEQIQKRFDYNDWVRMNESECNEMKTEYIYFLEFHFIHRFSTLILFFEASVKWKGMKLSLYTTSTFMMR